ncbi:thioesterase family protein [Paenibacillus sp. MMS20-IR301]|uniref:acyl-CoA thioesterase n=1 Tax=Paenibacillus sp. MMS20-IR301 TaxID=2895946 RepID=UPI0028E65ACE|nr:thioesterase family protein [Paenibacillus sp. MMS20-IR301]WNS46371.1 thioesterase family protein [Paenibacillus sp. MMS20-IR301]
MNSSKPDKASRWYGASIRVRYQETDRMGVVYHANYLTWFETGRTEMFRQLGLTYRSMEEAGLLLPVIQADLQFKSPARYDDHIAVYARLTTFSALRVVYEYEIRRVAEDGGEDGVSGSFLLRPENSQPLPGELLVSGATSHVWLNREWKPVRIDRAQPELFRAILAALNEEEGGAV